MQQSPPGEVTADQALKKACEFIASFTGSCPLDSFAMWMDCDNCNDGRAACWERYFKELSE